MPLKVLLCDEVDRWKTPVLVLKRKYDTQVQVVEKQHQALDLLAQRAYDVVVIEPFRDAHIFLKENPFLDIAKDAKRRRIPVVLATAFYERDLKKNGLVEGRDYDAYLGKPFDIKEFADVIKRVTSGK
ncbi:response regulator [Candidatus Pacearchaeota archaeon]|nr:response regulator [Candidatus Pacearchaeota archaeon]